MKNILTILAIALLFSCNSSTKSNEEISQLTIDQLVNSAENLKDEIISVEGMVTHVCREGGQKMFMTNGTKEINLLVRVSESIPEFDVALEGSNVKVTGKLIVSYSDIAADEMHEGESSGMEAEECVTEKAMNEMKDGAECKSNVTFHLEATSYKEII